MPQEGNKRPILGYRSPPEPSSSEGRRGFLIGFLILSDILQCLAAMVFVDDFFNPWMGFAQ
jgi:hypothetical protein